MAQQTYGEWMRSNPPINNLTAVEWLYHKLSTCTSDEMVGNINNWFEQAKQMEKEQQTDHIGDITEMVTRFEVIDHTSKKRGRIVVEYNINVEVSIQDDGRTMKVFLTDKDK